MKISQRVRVTCKNLVSVVALSTLFALSQATAGTILQDSDSGGVTLKFFDPVGQSFIAEDEHILFAFSFIQVNPASPNDPLQFSLYEGEGVGGTLLDTVSVSLPSTLPSGCCTGEFFDVDFSDTTLTIGNSYTVAVTAPTDSALWSLDTSQVDLYSGGSAFYGIPHTHPDLRFRVTPTVSDLTPDAIIINIHDEIAVILADVVSPPPVKAVKRLVMAQGRLDKALQELASGNTAKALGVLKHAAMELLKAQKDGVGTDALIDELVEIAKDAAETALEAALPFGLTSPAAAEEIAKAEKDIAKAEEELANGRPDKAINAYRKALSHAEVATTL